MSVRRRFERIRQRERSRSSGSSSGDGGQPIASYRDAPTVVRVKRESGETDVYVTDKGTTSKISGGGISGGSSYQQVVQTHAEHQAQTSTDPRTRAEYTTRARTYQSPNQMPSAEEQTENFTPEQLSNVSYVGGYISQATQQKRETDVLQRIEETKAYEDIYSGKSTPEQAQRSYERGMEQREKDYQVKLFNQRKEYRQRYRDPAELTAELTEIQATTSPELPTTAGGRAGAWVREEILQPVGKVITGVTKRIYVPQVVERTVEKGFAKFGYDVDIKTGRTVREAEENYETKLAQVEAEIKDLELQQSSLVYDTKEKTYIAPDQATADRLNRQAESIKQKIADLDIAYDKIQEEQAKPSLMSLGTRKLAGVGKNGKAELVITTEMFDKKVVDPNLVKDYTPTKKNVLVDAGSYVSGKWAEGVYYRTKGVAPQRDIKITGLEKGKAQSIVNVDLINQNITQGLKTEKDIPTYKLKTGQKLGLKVVTTEVPHDYKKDYPINPDFFREDITIIDKPDRIYYSGDFDKSKTRFESTYKTPKFPKETKLSKQATDFLEHGFGVQTPISNVGDVVTPMVWGRPELLATLPVLRTMSTDPIYTQTELAQRKKDIRTEIETSYKTVKDTIIQKPERALAIAGTYIIGKQLLSLGGYGLTKGLIGVSGKVPRSVLNVGAMGVQGAGKGLTYSLLGAYTLSEVGRYQKAETPEERGRVTGQFIHDVGAFKLAELGSLFYHSPIEKRFVASQTRLNILRTYPATKQTSAIAEWVEKSMLQSGKAKGIKPPREIDFEKMFGSAGKHIRQELIRNRAQVFGSSDVSSKIKWLDEWLWKRGLDVKGKESAGYPKDVDLFLSPIDSIKSYFGFQPKWLKTSPYSQYYDVHGFFEKWSMPFATKGIKQSSGLKQLSYQESLARQLQGLGQIQYSGIPIREGKLKQFIETSGTPKGTVGADLTKFFYGGYQRVAGMGELYRMPKDFLSSQFLLRSSGKPDLKNLYKQSTLFKNYPTDIYHSQWTRFWSTKTLGDIYSFPTTKGFTTTEFKDTTIVRQPIEFDAYGQQISPPVFLPRTFQKKPKPIKIDYVVPKKLTPEWEFWEQWKTPSLPKVSQVTPYLFHGLPSIFASVVREPYSASPSQVSSFSFSPSTSSVSPSPSPSPESSPSPSGSPSPSFSVSPSISPSVSISPSISISSSVSSPPSRPPQIIDKIGLGGAPLIPPPKRRRPRKTRKAYSPSLIGLASGKRIKIGEVDITKQFTGLDVRFPVAFPKPKRRKRKRKPKKRKRK